LAFYCSVCSDTFEAFEDLLEHFYYLHPDESKLIEKWSGVNLKNVSKQLKAVKSVDPQSYNVLQNIAFYAFRNSIKRIGEAYKLEP